MLTRSFLAQTFFLVEKKKPSAAHADGTQALFPLTRATKYPDPAGVWWAQILRGLSAYYHVDLPFPPDALPSSALRHPVTGASYPHYLSANLAALTARTGVEGARSDDPLTTLRGVLRINVEKEAEPEHGADWTLVES